MKLFKSKEEKAQEKRAEVRKSMRELKNRIAKLKAQENKYIEAAQVAMREELPEQVQLAKSALKSTIAERKRTYKMLLNAEIISQMKDTAQMTESFLNAVHIISKEIAGSTSRDMTKLTNELKLAMDKVAGQTEDLDAMLQDSQEDMGDYTAESELVSDDEVEKLIYGAKGAADTEGDDIDAELAKIKRTLDE